MSFSELYSSCTHSGSPCQSLVSSEVFIVKKALFIYDSIQNDEHDDSVYTFLQADSIIIGKYMTLCNKWSSRKYPSLQLKGPHDHVYITIVNGLPEQSKA